MQSPERQRHTEAPPAPLVANGASLQPGSTPSIAITPRTLWLAAGVVVSLVIVWLLLTHALAGLLIVFTGIIIAEAARPIALRLERYRVPRPLGVLLTLVAAFIALGILVYLMLSPLVSQVGALTAHAPGYAAHLQALLNGWSAAIHANQTLGPLLDSVSSGLVNSLRGFVPTLVSVPLTLVSGTFGALLSLVVIVTVAAFWLTSSAALKPFLLSLFTEETQPRVEAIFAEMGLGLGGYVRGVLVAMALIGVLTGAGLGLLGVPYALLLGVLAGLTEAIPYLGPWLSGSVAVVVALVTVDPVKALEVAALFLVIQLVEGNLVQPLVMSRAVHLDPLLVLVAILVGSELLGLVGAVLAVPFASLAQTLVTQAIAPAIRRAAGRPPFSGQAPTAPSSPAQQQERPADEPTSKVTAGA